MSTQTIAAIATALSNSGVSIIRISGNESLNIINKIFKTSYTLEPNKIVYGKIIKNIGKDVGSISAEIDPFEKYMRSAGYGEGLVKNNDFISAGLCPGAF